MTKTEAELAEWERQLTDKLVTDRLITLPVNPDYDALAGHVIDYLLNQLGATRTQLAFLRENWWSWTPDAEIADPTTYDLNRAGERTPERAVYRGKFSKRLAKALWVRCGLKLPDSTGDMLAKLVLSAGAGLDAYHFDFVKQITWNAGDFGDDGSCYWSSNRRAKEVLGAEPDFYAMRFYAAAGNARSYDTGQGLGRAWLVLRQISLARGRIKVPFVFNGYWACGNSAASHDYLSNESNCTKLAAKVLAQYLDAEPRELYLKNSGTGATHVYINLSKGYAVAPAGCFASTQFDIQVDMPDDNLPMVCLHCQTVAKRKNMIYPATGDGPLCKTCYAQLFTSCGYCGETYRRDTLTEIKGARYCPGCIRNYFYTCASCHETYNRRNLERMQLGEQIVCRTCYDKLTVVCAQCGGRQLPERMRPLVTLNTYVNYRRHPEQPLTTGHICPSCRGEYVGPCLTCGEYVQQGAQIVAANGRVQCAVCYDKELPPAQRATAYHDMTTCANCGALSAHNNARNYCPRCAARYR